MIKLSNSSILLICPDGTKKKFDAEEIEARIIKSCLAAGIREAWIAEDISLAVEFSLESLGGNEHFFALSEINATVVKILQETGYPEVAEKYMSENALAELELEADKKNLSDIFSTHLGLEGKTLDILVNEVILANSKLGIKTASPSLFLEMARHFKKSSPSLPPNLMLNKQAATKNSPWIISKENIRSQLSSDTMELFDNNILSINGVSRLFPSMKIDFRILNLMQNAKLEPPVTELSVFPLLNKLADSVNEIMKTVSAEYSKIPGGNETLPFYLFVNDMSAFARDWLSYNWPEGESACMDIIEYFEKMIDYRLFKIKLK